MKKENIDIFDLQRILWGDVPGIFYVELFIRSLAVYLMIAFAMKFLGKRVSAELNRSELAAVATVAAATGLVILAPDRGLLPPVIVLTVMWAIKWFINIQTYKHDNLESIVEGHLSILVNDGILQLDEMKKVRISKEQLFAQLRSSEIIHLGMVKRLYFEASGAFSIVEYEKPAPGLSVIPSWDEDFIAEQTKVTDSKVCCNCGTTKAATDICEHCKSDKWETPIEEKN